MSWVIRLYRQSGRLIYEHEVYSSEQDAVDWASVCEASHKGTFTRVLRVVPF